MKRIIRLKLFSLFNILFLAAPVITASSTDTNSETPLQPPAGVKVEAVSDTSMTLSWQPPKTSTPGHTPGSFVIRYGSDNDIERTITVGANDRSKLVTDLQPSTNYTVSVSAIYSGNRSESLPKFIVSTGPRVEPRASCDCENGGTLSCVAVPGSRAKGCTCKSGYEGKRCDACAKKFYPTGNECQPCSCSSLTSTGHCDPNIKFADGRACHCLPGHFGPNCTECSSDRFWYVDRCLPCMCLVTCPSESNDADTLDACRNCDMKLNASAAAITACGPLPESDQVNGGKRMAHGDGTVALIAVMVSLGFIAIVAGSITCYRYKCQRPNHHTFWSMELHEEKISLNSACDYQRLDAAAAATGSSTVGTGPHGPTASTVTEAGPLALRGREETRNGYHSMSM